MCITSNIHWIQNDTERKFGHEYRIRNIKPAFIECGEGQIRERVSVRCNSRQPQS